MSALSEVSVLIGQRAGDLEKARETFTAETRAFVTGILAAISVRVFRRDPTLEHHCTRTGDRENYPGGSRSPEPHVRRTGHDALPKRD